MAAVTKASRPSPAFVLAVLALVAALAGTAIAAPDAMTRAVTKSKVKSIAKKQANKRITARESSLSVDNSAKLGGQPASAYLLDSAVRYAKVNTNGTVDAAVSKGITSANITKDGTGDYCIGGLNPAPGGGVSATLDYSAPFGAQIYAIARSTTAGLCAGSQVMVSTFNSANAGTDMPFYVVIH